MGLQIAALMLFFGWLGSLADSALNITNNLLLALGIILGLFVSLYLIIKDISK
jgi:hypothetical protein